MRTGQSTTLMPTDQRESNEEARAALRRVVQAMRAHLADMDRLLDRAERLVSVRSGTPAQTRTNSEHQRSESPKGKIMSEAGRKPSRAEARSFNRVEEIASAYLIQANENPSLALRRAIDDALADLSEMERLVSRGYVRTRAAQSRKTAVDEEVTLSGVSN